MMTTKSIKAVFAVRVHAGHHARVMSVQRYAPVVLTLGATMLWAVSLKGIDIRQMNDLGLVSVLPAPIFVAMGMTLAGFCLTLHQRRLSEPVALLHVIALIVMFYGIMPAIGQVPDVQATWRHIGLIEYIMRTGRMAPTLTAYFDWPGFFILSALMARVTGLDGVPSMIGWAPVFFNVLYLGPLLMMLNAATSDKRIVWLGVWVFYLTNWVEQDHFSPQAFDYFLNLVVLGILVQYFRTPTPTTRSHDLGRTADELGVPRSPGQRAALMAITMALFVAGVASHQLTPFATLASVAALVMFRRCTARSLPAFMVVVLLAWLCFVASPFLSGHLSGLTRDVGAVHEIVSADLTERFNGSPQHTFVVHLRVFMTLAVWGLAGLGALRRLRRGQGASDLTFALLACAPFPLLIMQSYGGEMLLRIYLYALPAVIFFGAALFYPTPASGTSWRATAAMGLTCAVLLSCCIVSRYGNETIDVMTSQDVQAVRYLYQVAEPGSAFVALSWDIPWQFKDIEKHAVDTISIPVVFPNGRVRPHGADHALLAAMPAPGAHLSYLIITPSEKAELQLMHGIEISQVDRLVRDLLASRRFRLVYDKGHAQILVPVPAGQAGRG